MLNISTASKNLYKQNRLPNVASLAEVHLFVEILGTGTILSDDNIEQENFELEESICSENELYFGLCESAMCKFAVYNVSESLIGKQIHVWQTIGDNAEVVSLGYFKISEETKRDGNTGLWKDIVAYDYLSEALDTDVLAWWKSLWTNNTWLSVGNIWKSLLTHLGIQYTQMSLANDNARITNNINPSNLTARNILQACGELSGVFGQMGRDGKFKWVSIYDASHTSMIYPSETLYPSTSLFPIQLSGASYGSEEELSGTNPIYFADQSQYEDYTVQPIDCVIVQNYDGALATKVGDTETNPYIVFGNFLTWGMSTSEQNLVASNLLAIIYGITYVPNMTSMIGLPYLECGDVIEIVLANDKTIVTPIFQRVLTGIMSLTDAVTAQGTEYRTNKADSTKMTFALDAEDAVTRMLLTQTEDSILAEVATTYTTREQVESIVEISREGILLEVSAEYPDRDEVENSIRVAVDGITLKGVTIDLTANDVTINSDNFKVDTEGNVWANNGEFSGKINADSGTIGIYTIDNSGIKHIGQYTDTKYILAQYYSSRIRLWHNTTSSGQFQNGTVEAFGVQFDSVYGSRNAWVQGYGYYSTGDIISDSFMIPAPGSNNYFILERASSTTDPAEMKFYKFDNDSLTYNKTVELNGYGDLLFPYVGQHGGSVTVTRQVKIHDGNRIEIDYGFDQNTSEYSPNGNPGIQINSWNSFNGNLDTSTSINGYSVMAPEVIQTSDRRLKDDIEDVDADKASDFYKRLRPRSYKYKSVQLKGIRYGLIAQEVQDAIDESGMTDSSLVNTAQRADGEFLTLAYDQLHAFHIKMIQEQQKLIEDLTKRIETLENIMVRKEE